VGSIGVGANAAPAVWLSSDADDWPNAAEAPDPSEGTAGTIDALVGSGGGLVAAGTLLPIAPVAWLADVS
jgi:hypothetical protein